MRFTNRHKLNNKNGVSTKRLPQIRILKFKRPKWLKIQKILKRAVRKYSFKSKWNKQRRFLNKKQLKKLIRKKKFWWKRKIRRKDNVAYQKALPKKVSTRWIYRLRNRRRYQLELRRHLLSLFDKSINFEIEKSLKDRKDILINFLIKPYYRLDLLLWNLDYFSSSFESRQKINNKKVLVNGKIGKSNYYLKKGDIISFSTMKGKKRIRNDFIKNRKRYRKNYCFFSFLEVDYYSNNIIIVKDFFEFGEEDLRLLIEENIQVRSAYR